MDSDNSWTMNHTGLLELKDLKVTDSKNMSIMAIVSKDSCPQLSTDLKWIDNITVFEEMVTYSESNLFFLTYV